MLQLIDDETASRYYNEIDTATGDDLQSKISALESWATAKKAEQHRQEWDQVSGVFTDFDNYSASEGLDAFDEESRYQYANRQFVAHQTGGKFEDQMFVYPSKRDEVTDQMFGKTGLSEAETFNLIKGAVESRKATESAIRELPGVLAKGVLQRAAEGKEFDEVDSWFAFSGWKERHADKLAGLPDGWESAMLDSAVKLHARTEALMADMAPESKRAMDVLMKFTRPEDAESLPDADRTDVETLAKDFAKLTPEQRDGIYATLSYAAEAEGAGMGKGFWEKVGEGVARGGVNIYDDAAMTAEDRQARQNISFFQDLLDKPQAEPDRMQTADSIQMQRDMAQAGLEENQQRLKELRVMREIRDLAQGRIDPIKTEMDGVLGSVVQGAYDFSQSAAYTGMAMIPYVGLPAVMGALANSNYLRMLDEYPDMDADAAYNLSLAIAGPQAVIERFQGGLLLGKLPYLNQAMKRLTDVRVPLPARLGLGYAGVVGAETVTELAQEAMPVVADQLAAAVRDDMPEFDPEKAWGQYREQAPKIFYSMLWGGLIGGGAVGIRELDRTGVFMRNVQELEMHGITGEAAQNIAAEQDPDTATTMFREAWDKRTPEDIQAGISKRAAMLDAAQATQENPDLPTRRVEQAPDGTITHIIEQNGQAVYRTSDPAAADMALINITRMMDRSRITGTTTGIVESLQFIDQVNQATNRGEDVQKLLIDGAPRTLLDDYEANPTEQNLENLFATVRAFGQDISEPAELANFPVLASNQGALAEGIFKSVIRIQDGATGVEVMRDFSQDNLKRAIAENRVTMDWVREQLNQVIPLIESDRIEGRKLGTETDTDVIESFSDVAVAYMNGRIRDEQIPAGFRGFLRRMAIVVKDIFRRAYRLKRAIADGKVDANFESFLAESVGLNQQTLVDTTRERISNEVLTDTSATNYSIGSPAFQNWFADSKAVDAEGKPMVVYHGTQRPDRVGSRFRKTRATSGPMAFFTNDPAIASSYATNKADTSAKMPSDYAGWFKWKGKGMRSPVNIDQAWWNLSEAERATIKERIYTVGYSNADEYTGPIVADSQSIMSRDSIDYELRQARGNALRALVEMWLSSGSLFNQEEKFLEVLQAAGVKGAALDDPNAARSAVYPVYLSIKNPLDTASIPENVVAALEQASKGKRAKRAIGGNPDAWDKNTISGKDWMAALKEDIANGTTYAWTRIPDWATQALSSLGYDGIKDTGGKRGGESHQVWIPFYETQIKSATGNRGTFDPTSPNINYSIGANYFPEDKYNQIIPEISSVNPNKVSRRDMYEVAKVSPDVAANMSFEEPIEVSLFADGTLMLSDGHHRLAAAKQLGMNSIPAVVRSINAKGKHINALIVEQQPSATNYSIGMTVAPLRRDSLSELNKKEMQKRASSAKFIHLQQVIDDVAKAYGVKIESRQPVIGGWVESGQISLEVPEAILFDTDDLDMAQEMAAIVGASAPELQNAVMLWKDDDAGKDTVLEFQAKGADSALAIAKDLNNAGLNGFTYDTKTRKFSLVLAGLPPESIPKVYDYINDQSKTGNISSRGGTQTRAGVAAFPSESDYRGYIQGARSRADLLQQGQREALLDVVDRAERRVDRYASALKISEQAKKIQKKLKRPSTSALAIETELKGKQFENIRQLGLFLDSRFNKVFGKPSFEIGGQEGIDIASDAFVYDIIDGLAGDGSGMGWYDERVQETIRELTKLHPEFATDSNALAVYIGILATTSQGYTVVENFKQANKVYNEYKRTGRIPTDFKFAKSSDPINSNLAQIQGLIDQFGLDGYAEFMDQEVTGQALRDQFGKTPTGVTLKDTVRGNRVLGPKIGSFFNNLRGQFDTITMDLWYTRTMHRFLGETVVPLDSEKMQKAITKFREELKKDGVRTYGIDLTEALKDDEATVQAALTLFQRWARGDNDYTEKGYFKFPDGYKIEKAARGIFSIGGMKGAPQNKTHRQYFAKVVLEAKAKLAKLGLKLTEADMQAIIWYREKNLFARTGVANAAAKPADYLDAVMVARSGAQAQEDVDPADLEAEDGDTNYSIASQSQIDRVNKALGGMNRGPDARIAVYERAKAKFSTLLQNNQQALDNLRAGTVSFRRTQLLQALGELDAILSIFPPDIRGRVGGYTRLASIAPHDVFKDGEKVSEVSGMNGAIISAWMREGLSIGPAGQQTELPPGYTAKENLGTARADRSIADFFKKRIEMIDRELEKTLRREYDEAFRKLLDRTKPKKAKPGEKPKGIGGDIQDLFAVVRNSVDMNATQVAAHIAGLDSMIASGELTAEQEARATVEAALVALTGDWRNADADRRRTALMEASRIWNGAYAEHAQKIIRQREEREIARAEAIVATGKAGELAGRKSKAIADSGLKGSWKDYILNLLNFDQVVGVLFGENTEVANTIIDKQRRAENAKEDGSQAKMQELEDFFTGLAGGNLFEGEKLRYRLTQPSMTVNGIEMSELEALSAVMMWAQEDGRRHMEGEMDDTGKPSGKWHYNQDFVDEILANLSTEALALRDWLGQRYADEYSNINAVYSELNGVNLPQIRNYSPVTVQPVNAPTGQVLDPVSGSAMSGASASPGALRTRGTAIAEPRFQDVLQTYISHTLQMEHWKAFAPMIAEANGILRNRDVQNSVEEKGGAEARKMLNAWLDYFAQGGTRDAGAHLALNQGLNNVLGRASQVALVGRVSTLLIQSTQLGAALAEMPVKAYLKRMGKLLTGQLGWDAALNSDYIQRRVKQMPPVVQLAMQGLKGAKPTAIQQAGKRLGMLLSGADGLFTAGTYAITYDYHLTKAKELGLAGQEAEDYARNIAERVTDRIAQPTRAGARSLYENTSTNPLARAGWAFASEARKNLAITAYSFAERDTATKMRTLAYVVALNSIGASILRSIWRDILDDDDDELFDDKYWSPKRIAMAVATEPFYGFPVLGSVVQEAVNKSFGEYQPSGSLFSVDRAIGPIKRLPDHLSGNTDLREVMRDIDMVVSALGIMHPNIAATASITHLAKDLFNIGDSAVDAVTED